MGCQPAIDDIIPRDEEARVGQADLSNALRRNEQALEGRQIGFPDIAFFKDIAWAWQVYTQRLNKEILEKIGAAIRIVASPNDRLVAISITHQINQGIRIDHYVVVHHPNPVRAKLERSLHPDHEAARPTSIFGQLYVREIGNSVSCIADDVLATVIAGIVDNDDVLR